MMRIEPPGFFDPDFQLLNYTCENGCCEIVLHIRKEGKKKGEKLLCFWTGWKTTKEATKWCSQSNSVCWLHRFFRFCVPRDLESSSRLIYPHLARVCNAVTFFKSKVFHFSSMFLRLFLRFLSVILQPSDGGNVTSSTLRFQPKVSDMGKILRCRAENPVMPASQIEDTWNLDINCE